MSFDCDLFVIGAGSGGVRAARMSAGHGAKVAVAEEYRVGGTCVIRGCVPKKLFVYASHFAEEFEDAAGFGWTVADAKFDWPTLVKNKDAEIDRLNGIYIKNLEASGVEILQGRAIVKDAHTVTLDGLGNRPEELEGLATTFAQTSAFRILSEEGARLLGAEIERIEHLARAPGLGLRARDRPRGLPACRIRPG